ncbi:MAG: phosphodiester glycosidase family protein, partial [Nitrospinota bacterium]|nr:phosphodiester glycosidase family protein [Nitrospinota bacterium]
MRRNGGGGRWQGLSPGLEVKDYRFLFTDESSARMTAVRVDLEVFRVRLRWLANGALKFSTADVLGQDLQIGVLANAGYFDENGRPLGFFLSGGKTYNRRLLFRGKKLALHLGAVFSVRAGTEKVGIATREEFELGAEAEGFQAGPLLVRAGMPTAGLEGYREFRRPDQRTVIALGRRGRLLVLVSEETGGGISWCELQVVLSRSEREGGLGIETAMNLDGGSSSQLFI